MIDPSLLDLAVRMFQLTVLEKGKNKSKHQNVFLKPFVGCVMHIKKHCYKEDMSCNHAYPCLDIS